MINILLSNFDITHKNAYESLKEYFKPMSKVVVLPYSNWEYLQDEEHFEELFDYNKGKEFNDIANKFHMYGIQKEDISVINPKDSVEFVLEKIKKADVCLLTGGCPTQFMRHIPFEVYEELDNVKILTGISSGSMVQCSMYYLMKDYQDDAVGLVKKDRYEFGMCFAFDVVVPHWDPNNKILKKGVERYRGKHFDDLILLQDGDGIVYRDCILIDHFIKEV